MCSFQSYGTNKGWKRIVHSGYFMVFECVVSVWFKILWAVQKERGRV